MRRTADLIAERFEAWGDVPHVVRAVSADPTPDGIAAALHAFSAASTSAQRADCVSPQPRPVADVMRV